MYQIQSIMYLTQKNEMWLRTDIPVIVHRFLLPWQFYKANCGQTAAISQQPKF